MAKKIAILTSGGDSPGMNNAIRTIVKTSKIHGIEVFLVYNGYKGLVEKTIKNANEINVDQYIGSGGTFIGSARYLEFKKLEVRQKAVQNLKEMGIDSLVVIGGDGSYAGAQLLHELGVKTIGLPGTIDNDIASTEYTIGLDTALNTIVENVDRLRDTMNSMNMVALVEVMGHGAGDLAMLSGLATGAEIIVTNAHRKSIDEMIEIVKDQMIAKTKRSVIGIVSEFIYDDLKKVAKEIEDKTGIRTRAIILAHTQRGGNPKAYERINASFLGIAAVESLLKNESGVALGFKGNKIISTPIPEALKAQNSAKNENELVTKINKINQS
ncbi:6-phosphofructokinase [[Mycoplasma] mobile]|uniref:ATP-dependent 6-phosphofructokinase n=1 Tax=Mycoplasma mobile (strain ATCC 43663 / 163K / NCTC 11711) TaxID=267748 RepID=PFKA_MYCM1|nr:6-phosphofructokinase [[Mycoplasma] mobile]Q6KHX0.1 RecName: Full=ATP-dependent 6-phosphofructokinase; Short=ATP-PFK; Short=Phosphofructokinase; AltName: Full=Phosphohexokinase [Mycoplasma mobile 163K]AAT27806.1 6-phosphofructokinase [Mycoplasma mobile 163K]